MANKSKQVKTSRNSSRVLKVKGGRLRKQRGLRPRAKVDRVLRERSNHKANESLANQDAKESASVVKSRKRRSRKKRKRVVEGDEYSVIRKRLRYMLNRMSYEKNLISAYSADGWRGSNAEKVKPSKELERAQKEIVGQKLKIRDMIKHVDETLSYGKLEESLFDSDGQIGSEDIFCAKCGSKDLTPENDIILCDGVCDRGFHQLCLEPPLLKEQIPSDEDGWLCPGCDCKVDCIDLLNEMQGAKLSIHSTWEKVFPEVASSSNGESKTLSESDESDEDDYDPEGKEKNEGDESSSDESLATSSSKKLLQQATEMPSEDEEDDDYDPDKCIINDDVAKDEDEDEDSGSDFSSDSEDLGAICRENDASLEDESVRSGTNDSDAHNGNLDLSDDVATPIDGKRSVTRLDYKKLYDETYGKDGDGSSEDEDYVDIKLKGSRKKGEGTASESANGETKRRKRKSKNVSNSLDTGKGSPLKKRLRGKAKQDEKKGAKRSEGSKSEGVSKSRSLQRLGKDAKKRLLELFEENRYPNREAKESIARELGLTTQQVHKWFDNARCLSKRKSSATLKPCCSINN